MGLGIFRWKILLIILSVLLFWQSSKIWLNYTQGKSGIKGKNPYVHNVIKCQIDFLRYFYF